VAYGLGETRVAKHSSDVVGFWGKVMKTYRWALFVIVLVSMVRPVSAQQRVIVRDKLGLAGLNLTCRLLNCTVALNLGGPSGATEHGAKVLSMSFSFRPSSKEMAKAIDYAKNHGLISVASVGNDGQDVAVYPAALPNVMGVASTTDYDTRSTFSNYGSDVWVAAPGEGIVSTYPYGTYAAGWWTSFSAPFVSGTAALLVSLSPKINQQSAAAAIAHAKWVGSDMGNGRLDVYSTLQSRVAPDQTN